MASSDDRPAPRPLRRALSALPVAVIVVAAAVVMWTGSAVWANRTAQCETEQLAGAATEVALLLSALSSADAEASLDRVEELSTGPLREEVSARRSEVVQLVDDDEVSAHARVIASGVEQAPPPRGMFSGSDEPATARLLIATRAEVSNTGIRVARAEFAERTWRWRIVAVMVDGQARVSSAEVAV